jgi:2-methylcitrate dehydratase PrpD
VDNSIREESADVTAVLKDGRKVHVFVEHAIGSMERPMSDAALEQKFHAMSDVVIGKDQSTALIQACWNLGKASDVRALAKLAAGG